MKKKNIYMIYIPSCGYYYNKYKFVDSNQTAKRYKTFNAILKLYEKLLLTFPDAEIHYEIHSSKKIGRIVHEHIDYIGKYDLTEYYNKLKAENEIKNHVVNIISTLKKEVETNLSTEDDFWK